MAIYRYPAGSPLSEVTVRRVDDRAPVALLAIADAAKASEIRRVLAARGWPCVPVNEDGRDLLQVSGFGDETSLRSALEQSQCVAGTPHITATPVVITDSGKSRWQKFFDRYSLQLAGLLNLIGDVSLLKSGMKDRDTSATVAGALYTAGGANLTLFGGTSPDQAVQHVSEETADFIRQQTGNLPEGSALAGVAAAKPTGALADAQRFLQKNPAQVTLVPYIGGASAMLVSGVQSYRADNKRWANMAAGISSVFFKTASFLIPEKAKSEEGAKPNNLIDWIREKPLRLFGYGSFITDLLMGGGAFDDFKSKKAGWGFKALTSGLYLSSDLMMAISHKDPSAGKLTGDEQTRVEAMAAEAIAAAPIEQRAILTEKVAGFLVSKPQIQGNAASVKQALSRRIDQLGKSAWATRTEPAAPTGLQQNL